MFVTYNGDPHRSSGLIDRFVGGTGFALAALAIVNLIYTGGLYRDAGARDSYVGGAVASVLVFPWLRIINEPRDLFYWPGSTYL